MRRVDAVPDDLAAALSGVIATLRTMPAGKLATSLPGTTRSRADAGRLLARAVMIATQGIEDADQLATPAWRALPELPDLAVGDQLSVLAQDLRNAARFAPSEVWTPDGRALLSDVLRDVLATAEEVARLL